ncbi:MAG: hypothetical protein JW746_02980 [Candidatus Krumholzibacteriota bacterium]|nr:hypothetical protein [Candidatus Krumholzibacteriota bacterium]
MSDTKRYVSLALLFVLVFAGCKVVDTQKKDLALQEMDALEEKYVGKKAWTRSLLVNIETDKRVDQQSITIIDRDVEVKVLDLDMHWNGAVTVKGPDRKVVRHALNVERPMTIESYEEALSRALWFKKPEYRYRMNLRKYGKKMAKAIANHELFKGMDMGAALESWGYPNDRNQNEIGGIMQEQWIYKDPRDRTKKRFIYLKDGLVDSWDE